VTSVGDLVDPVILGVDEISGGDLRHLGLEVLTAIGSIQLVSGDESSRDVNGNHYTLVLDSDITFSNKGWDDVTANKGSGGVIESAQSKSDDTLSILGSTCGDDGILIGPEVVENRVIMVIGIDVTEVVVGEGSGGNVSENSELVVGSTLCLLTVSLVVGDQVEVVSG
jgi:hypothetical protein